MAGQLQRCSWAAQHRRCRWRHNTVQNDDTNLSPSGDRGLRLAVSPDAEHRVVCARVELGDDGNLHR
jgi:hypothetical protein